MRLPSAGHMPRRLDSSRGPALSPPAVPRGRRLCSSEPMLLPTGAPWRESGLGWRAAGGPRGAVAPAGGPPGAGVALGLLKGRKAQRAEVKPCKGPFSAVGAPPSPEHHLCLAPRCLPPRRSRKQQRPLPQPRGPWSTASRGSVSRACTCVGSYGVWALSPAPCPELCASSVRPAGVGQRVRRLPPCDRPECVPQALPVDCCDQGCCDTRVPVCV